MKEVIQINENLIKVTLQNKYIKVELLNLGASIFSLFYNDIDIIVGPKDINYFIKENHHYGKTIGRFCGRLPINGFKIGNKDITLSPYRNEHSTIHGGKLGFSRRYFKIEESNDNEVIFSLFDQEVEGSMPGDINFKVTYKLTLNELLVKYEATSTKDTIFNITNHAYFNLENSKDILGHELIVEADKYVVFDRDYNILDVSDVSNTVYDLRKKQLLKEPISKLKNTPFKGFDTIYLLNENKKTHLSSELSNINLTIETDYPSVVVYTHNDPSPDNFKYFMTNPYHGVALECMYEPGGITSPLLNDARLKKDEKFTHFVKYSLTTK